MSKALVIFLLVVLIVNMVLFAAHLTIRDQIRLERRIDLNAKAVKENIDRGRLVETQLKGKQIDKIFTSFDSCYICTTDGETLHLRLTALPNNVRMLRYEGSAAQRTATRSFLTGDTKLLVTPTLKEDSREEK